MKDFMKYVGAVLVAFTGFMFIGGVLYKRFGWFKKFFHDTLGWHEPIESYISSNGVNISSICKYCRKKIMQDSQGNWFEC